MRPLLLVSALSAVLLGSCFSPGDGQPPVLQQIYFPTGLALDQVFKTTPINGEQPESLYLYVASSDFDLQYNASALASYDLVKLASLVPDSCNNDADCANSTGGTRCDNYALTDSSGKPLDPSGPSFFCVSDPTSPCAPLAEHTAADQLLNPGRCASIDPVGAGVVHATVGIGAFATDVMARVRPATLGDNPPVIVDPGASERLFLPVRGDATLHWIDVNDDGSFDCGQANTSDHSCDGFHRAGDETDENADALRQPAEPFAIDADKDGQYLAITNQTTGSVSLFVNTWAANTAPTLEHVLTGLPTAPVGIVALPAPPLPSTSYEPGFLVAYRDAARIDLLRVHVDDPMAANGTYSPHTLNLVATTPINTNSIGSDSRGIVIDDTQRQADYLACQTAAGCSDLVSCEQQDSFLACIKVVHQPTVFVSNRAPASVIVGAFTPDSSYPAGTSELPAFTDSIPLNAGPSRIVLGSVKVPGTALVDERGTYGLEQRVFIVCFDSRRIYVYDPQRRVIEAIIVTGRGPYALAIDEQRGLGYVAHFTDSYLGVISLDQRYPQNYAAIVASVGVPSPPRTSK